jgi:hypothetical protein
VKVLVNRALDAPQLFWLGGRVKQALRLCPRRVFVIRPRRSLVAIVYAKLAEPVACRTLNSVCVWPLRVIADVVHAAPRMLGVTWLKAPSP